MACAPSPYNASYPYHPQQAGYQQQVHVQHGKIHIQQGHLPPQQGSYLTPTTPFNQVTNNVIVVQQQEPRVTQPTVVVQESKSQINHQLHFLITVFIFPPWIFVWITLCIMYKDEDYDEDEDYIYEDEDEDEYEDE